MCLATSVQVGRIGPMIDRRAPFPHRGAIRAPAESVTPVLCSDGAGHLQRQVHQSWHCCERRKTGFSLSSVQHDWGSKGGDRTKAMLLRAAGHSDHPLFKHSSSSFAVFMRS